MGGWRPRLWLGLALTLLLADLPAAGAGGRTAALDDWISGPVRYIADRAEVKAFKGLETDEDRALFIEKFWARRDPSPDTLTNEYRQLFWERVHDANELFLDSAKPGWKTDRGKIYVLHGAPNEIQDEPSLRPGGDLKAGHGVIRWIYEGRPSGLTDVNPVTVVAFQRETTGEYRLSTDPKLNSVFFDKLALREETPMDRVVENMFHLAPRSELSVMLDLGRMQEVPPQAQVLLERVETVEAYRTTPLQVQVSRYQHPEREGTLVVVTTDVGHVTPGFSPSVVARFSPRDATREPRLLGEDSFRIEELDGVRLAQARIVLDAGEYDLTVMALDPMSSVPGMYRGSLRAAEPSSQMRFSDRVWAADLEPLRYAALASHDEPFHVGPFRVVPRLADTFSPGETVSLFYEVYGGEPPYRISYTLEGQDVDGSWVTLGQPSTGEQNGSAQGWALPTSSGWPLGDYRISIEVRDSRDRWITTQMPFRLKATETAASE
jgi:GWxTD domain-containing protein